MFVQEERFYPAMKRFKKAIKNQQADSRQFVKSNTWTTNNDMDKKNR